MTKATSIPGRDSTLTVADGRTVAFSEWGDLGGTPVVFLHGWPGSRLLCPDLAATESAGVRSITVDRPGYGRSDPRVDTIWLDWVDDFVALADHLGLPACPVIGWSGGGPYALACAYRSPDRVPIVGLAASPGPYDEVPGARATLSEVEQAEVELVRTDRPAGIEEIMRVSRWYDRDGWESLFAEPWGAGDEQYRTDPDVVPELKAWMREGARQGSLGYAADGVAFGSVPRFSVSDVGQPVHVWIGEADTIVPRIHADHFMSALPRATLVSYPGEGHMFPLAHWGEMLAAVT